MPTVKQSSCQGLFFFCPVAQECLVREVVQFLLLSPVGLAILESLVPLCQRLEGFQFFLSLLVFDLPCLDNLDELDLQLPLLVYGQIQFAQEIPVVLQFAHVDPASNRFFEAQLVFLPVLQKQFELGVDVLALPIQLAQLDDGNVRLFFCQIDQNLKRENLAHGGLMKQNRGQLVDAVQVKRSFVHFLLQKCLEFRIKGDCLVQFGI